jgi:hypothetical protein
MSGMIPMYAQGVQRMLGLPSEIDQWTGNLVNSYQASTRDAMDAYGRVGNQMASRGVTGGTVPDYSRAIMLDQAAQRLQEQRANALSQGISQKVGAIMGVPSAAGIGMGQIPGMIGLGQQSSSMNYGSGSQSANYGGGSQSGGVSYQTDPTAWGGLIMNMLQRGYTG